MKAIEFLNWICNNSVNGEFINIVDVPEEGGRKWQQNEEWWMNMFGMYPPQPQASGKYLYYYASDDVPDFYDTRGAYYAPDFQIELPNEDTMHGYDYINFYKIEE